MTEQDERTPTTPLSMRFSLQLAGLALCISILSACATGTNPRDPLEPFNRGVYQFNETVDRAILKPVAEGYRFILPQFIRSSVSNFFSNINDVIVVLNNLLQGKFTTAYSDFGRIAINSTLGVLGLFDIASEAGIEKHDEDFGQTLGWWGMPEGPFIMLPFFGPSTGRDVVGRVGDYFSDPGTYVDPTRTRNQLWGTRVVNRRAELLDASKVLETAALDPYEFVRDAYLQRRRNLISDGMAPPPGREIPDAPSRPKPQTTPPQKQSGLPSGDDPSTVASILVSGEAHTPVVAAFPQGALPEPAALGKPVTTLAEAEGAAQPAGLTQFWRTLRLNFTKPRD
jgi:phospholipid-binding lipoprotein MlaA